MTARKTTRRAPAVAGDLSTARPLHTDGLWNFCPTCLARSTGDVIHQSVKNDKGKLVPCPNK